VSREYEARLVGEEHILADTQPNLNSGTLLSVRRSPSDTSRCQDRYRRLDSRPRSRLLCCKAPILRPPQGRWGNSMMLLHR
jgi:hypothetical protein